MAHSLRKQKRDATYADVIRAVEKRKSALVVKWLDHSDLDIVAAALSALKDDYKELAKGGLLDWEFSAKAKAVRHLVTLVQSEDDDIAADAAHLLRCYREIAAERPLLTFFNSRPSMQRMETIIRTLADIGTQQCVAHLLKLLIEVEESSIRTTIYELFIDKEQRDTKKKRRAKFLPR